MNEELYKEIGRLIYYYRTQRGLSQQALAQAIGFNTPGSISYFESGSRQISIDTLYAIAEKLGVHPFELLPDPELGGLVKLD